MDPNGGWNLGFSSDDDSDISSEGLVGDSASEGSEAGSDDETEKEAELEKHESQHAQKQTATNEPAEFSDPEYGYDSEDSENEVRELTDDRFMRLSTQWKLNQALKTSSIVPFV